MRIVTFADLHGDATRVSLAVAKAGRPDVVVLTGDITHFGGAVQAESILSSIRPCSPRVLAVAGNCDLEGVYDALEAEDISLDGRLRVIDGVAFLGAGRSLPCPGTTPSEMTESGFTQRLNEAAQELEPGMPLVLVVHQPPFGCLCDCVSGGRHVGSQAVRRFIIDRRPLLCLTGHIHEGRGIDRIEDTVIANPGPLRHGGYVVAEITAGAPPVVRLENA